MDNIIKFTEIYSVYNKKLDSSSINNNVSEIERLKSSKSLASQRKEQLISLKEKVNRCATLFSNNHSSELSNCIDRLAKVTGDYESVIDSLNEVPTEEDLKKISELSEQSEKLNEELAKLMELSYEDYMNVLFENIKSNKVQPDVLESYMNTLNLESNQKDVIATVLDKYNKELQGEVNAEQQTMEDEKGKKSESPSSSENGQNPDNSTENIQDEEQVVNEATIAYDKDSVYYEKVQKSRQSDRMNELDNQIEQLKAMKEINGKLSFMDAIKLSSLIEERENLKKQYINTKMNFADKNRENKLSDMNDKIEDYNKQYMDELKRQQEMKSKLFKYFSNRKSEKLASKIASLQAKMGKVQSKQAASAIHAYDSQNKFISLKAKLSGTKQVVGNIAKAVHTEIKNTISDFSRFVSRKGKVKDMQSKKCILAAAPKTINLQLPQYQVSTALSM